MHRSGAVRVVEPVEYGPLVGDVLVHDPQRLRLLNEDVARPELSYDPQFLRGSLRQSTPLGQIPGRPAFLRKRFRKRSGSLGETFARLPEIPRRGVRGSALCGVEVRRWTRGPGEAILGERPFGRARGRGWSRGTPLDGAANGGGNGFAGCPLLREADDLLRGVDVHVHAAGVRGDLDGHGRVAARRDRRPVCVVEATVQVLRPYEAAVHRDRLVYPAALRQAGKSSVARDTESPRLVLDPAQRARFGDAEHL